MALISILVANFNNGSMFEACFNSIVSQSISDWEVIIVDDGSTDTSVDIIGKIIANDQRFRLFSNKENRGCGYTKHRCIELATSELCCFLDPDDALAENALESMLQEHQANPNVVMVHSSFIYCDSHLKPVEPFDKAKSVEVNERFTNLDGAVTAFSVFKKSAYEKTLGIDRELKRAVDQDLYLKLSEVGQFKFLNKHLYLYRIHDSGISTSNKAGAFYQHLKVICSAENRRGVSLEEVVSPYLETRKLKSGYYIESNYDDPWMCLKFFWRAIKKKIHP